MIRHTAAASALAALLAAPAFGASLDFAPEHTPPPRMPAGADLYDFGDVDPHLFATTAFEFYYRHDRALDGHRQVPLSRPATLGPAWVELGGAYLDHLRHNESVTRVEAIVERQLEARAIETMCAGAVGEAGDFRDGGRVWVADAAVDQSLPSALGRVELYWQAACTVAPRSERRGTQFGDINSADYTCSIDWQVRDTYGFHGDSPQQRVGIGAPFTVTADWATAADGLARSFGCGAPRVPDAPADAPKTAAPDTIEVALRTVNGHYVVAEGGGGGALNSNRGAVGSWERFTWIDNRDGTVSLRSNAGRFVVAEGGGGGAANADRWEAHAWERFTPEFFADGSVALRTVNGHYLVAEGGGGGALNANRTAVGAWERFTLVPVSTHRVAVHAPFVGYWTADQAGGRHMDTAGEAIAAWERFTLVALGGGLVHFQAGSGQYVVAEHGGGGAVNANRHQPLSWETFTVEPQADGFVNIGTANGGALRADRSGGLFGGSGRGFDSQRFSIEVLSGPQPD